MAYFLVIHGSMSGFYFVIYIDIIIYYYYVPMSANYYNEIEDRMSDLRETSRRFFFLGEGNVFILMGLLLIDFGVQDCND